MNNKKPWLPIVVIFLIVIALIFAGKNWLQKQGIDHEVLLGGNIILFLATALSFLVYQRSLKSPNPQASVRGMYGSFIIKFFICLVAAMLYIMLAKKQVDKTALIICMGFYIVYSVLEVYALQKLLKQKRPDKI